jgi:dolichol-phosphate mannosyltransferase
MIRGRLVAVVVPAYRVESQIAPVLRAMPRLVDRIYVVDDASLDSTAHRAESVKDERVEVIRHGINQGVGGAVVTGFRAALSSGADLIVKCDGDGQMDPRDIPALVAPLVQERAEYAKGCRFHHGQEFKSMPWVRRLGNIGLTFLTKLASGYWHVLDPQNGFVAIRAGALRQLPLDSLARGYFFENDMLIRLNTIEARVIDVPLPAHYGDERSSLSPWRSLIDFPPRLLRGFLRRVLLRYVFYDISPVAVFGIIGATLFAAGTVYGAVHWIANARRGELTPPGTIIIAAVLLILGFQLLLEALVLDIQASPRSGSARSDPTPAETGEDVVHPGKAKDPGPSPR